MATYIPNATQTTEPIESRTVESAALEFRTLKASINGRIEDVQDTLDTEIVNRIAGDANLQTQNNAQDVRLTAVENALLFIGEGIQPGTVYVQRLSGTGAQTVFTLNTVPHSVNVVDIYINGIYQNKDTFTVSGADVTFSEAPPAGTNNIEVQVTVTIALGETDASLVTYGAATVADQLDAISTAGGSSLVGFQQAGTGAIVRTAQDKMREWVSVKDFGAVGDGVANDAPAILAAITAANGNAVKIPSGTYRITSLIEYSGPVSLHGEDGAVFIMEGAGRFLFSSAPVSIPRHSPDLPAGRNSVSFLSDHGLSPGDVFVLYNTQDYSWSSHRDYYRDGCMFKVDTVTNATTIKTYGVSPDTYTSTNFVAYKLAGQGVSIKDITLRPSASTATLLIWVDGHVGVDISGVVIEKGASYTGIEIWRCFDVRVSGCSGEISGGDSYPITISNSQKVTISDCELYSARHCIVLGGRTGVACVPTRDVLITHCNLYNASSSGIGAADVHGNCENIHYSNCYFNSGANASGANVKYSNCVIMGRDPVAYPDGNCVYGSEVVKGVFEFEDCRFVTYGDGASFAAFVYLGVADRMAAVTVRVKGCTGENRGGRDTIRCFGVGVGTALGAGNINLVVQDFTFVSSTKAFLIVAWAGTADVSSVASTVIDNLSAPSGSALVGFSNSANSAMPMRLPSQSGRQAITATSATSFTTGTAETFRYIYPRVPVAQVTVGNDTAKGYNGNRAIFGLCYRITTSAITPWIESGDATNWTATHATHVMWRVGIDEV